MSKKLLIAVLTLGLLFAFGMAFGDDGGGKKVQTESIVTSNPDAARYNDLVEVQRPGSSIQKPVAEVQAITPTTVLPPPYYCDFIDYSGAWAWFQNNPALDGAVSDIAMRFTPSEGYDCTLLTVYIAVYPGGFVGTPDMDVIVWDDDGFGTPGTELFRTTIPFASLPTATGWVAVDVSANNFVWSDGAEFHIGAAGNYASYVADGSQIAFLMDDGSTATGRHSIWYLPASAWVGWTTDYAYGFAVDICCAEIPFSDCYRQDYNCGGTGPFYIWSQPDAYGDDYFNMRMSVEGPETLSAVGVAVYNGTTGSGATYPQGTPDLDIFVWESDAGFPDLSAVIYQTTIPFASVLYYPDFNVVDLYSEGFVMRSDFHVGWSTNEASDPTGAHGGMSDLGACGEYRSSNYWGVWAAMLDDWGVDVNFLIWADMCRDRYSLCQTEADYCGINYVYGVPNGYGYDNTGYYQKVTPTGIACRLENVRIALYAGSGATMAENSQVQVYASDGENGLPLTLLGSIDLTPADYVAFPGWTEVDFAPQNILFDEDIWIGIESFATVDYDIAVMSDDGSCYEGQRACQKNPTYGNVDGFIYGDDFWADPANMVLEADVCCELAPEAACIPGEDWPTAAHDYRRTNRSMNTTGDAQCTQALSWIHSDAAGFVYSRPAIYGTTLIVSYNDKLQAYDIDSGLLLWTASGLPEMGAGFRNSVTVQDGFVYYGGGNGRSFTKADVTTGATIWSRNVLANPFVGNTVYTLSVVIDGVVYLTTSAGEVYALDDATGDNWAGWATNPVLLDGDTWATLASNGTDLLYVGTDGNLGTGYGTVYCIQAVDGAIVWATGEAALYPYAKIVDEIGETEEALTVQEEFYGPIAVDENGDVYLNSAFDPNTEVNGPPDGVLYRLDPDGNVIWGVQGGSPWFSGATLDINQVYFVGQDNWLDTEAPVQCLNKATGAVIWDGSEVLGLEGTDCAVEGILDCRPLEADFYYQGSINNQFLVFDADYGNILFEYNFENTGSTNTAGLAMDPTHLVLTSRQGDIFVMTEQVDRPRLRVLKTDEYSDVPFLSPASYPVVFEDVFMNNGCAALTGTLTADEVAPAALASAVAPARIDRMMTVADNMVDNDYASLASALATKTTYEAVDRDEMVEFLESPLSKDVYSNTAAYAPPGWLNGISNATINLGPGEVSSVDYDVNGPLVTRGAHSCYVTITTNDLYYLNNPAAHPTVQLGVVGGCVASTDTLYFGTTEQNYSVVYNSGMIAGDSREDGFMISIDGEEEYYCYFAGYLLFAQSPTKLAWTGYSDGTYWETLLADPNCAGQCETYFQRNIVLGQYTTDGYTYVDIYGEGGTYTYVDSVVNYDCYGTGWDCQNLDCGFDNSLTMGLSIKCTEYGAYGVPELNNFKICKLDITNRNVAPIVDPIYYGQWVDHDLGNDYDDGYDWGRFYFLADYDVAWGGACGGGFEVNTNIWGSGAIGHPMRGVRTLRQDMVSSCYMHDSAFAWMANYTGAVYQPTLETCYDPADDGNVGDRQAFYTYGGITIGSEETVSTGFYIFGYSSITGLGYNTFDTTLIVNTALAAQQFSGFGRGDINADNEVNLADVVALYNYVGGTGPGPKFLHLADVDNSGDVDLGDVLYLADYYFCTGAAPVGAWTLPDVCPAP